MQRNDFELELLGVLLSLLELQQFIILLARSVCDCLLDLLLDPHGRDPREDGPAGDTIPGASQHFQQCHYQHTQG